MKREYFTELNEPGVEYRDIPGFTGYKISSDGKVFSCRNAGRRKKGIFSVKDHWYQLKPYLRYICNIPYWHIGLIKDNGKHTTCTLHSLLLTSFVGPCPNGMQCRHLDSNSLNNDLNNLQWGTSKENSIDRCKSGKQTIKLTIDQVKEIALSNKSNQELAKIYDITPQCVWRIKMGDNWGWLDIPRVRTHKTRKPNLTEEQRIEIINSQKSKEELAKEFNIQINHINRLRRKNRR